MLSIYRYALLTLLLTQAGCGLILSDVSSSSNADATWRKNAAQEYRGANLARKVRGEAPLDSCSELYWHGAWMALEWKPCAARVRRWENGDSTALNPPGMNLETTRPVVSKEEQETYDRLEKKHPHHRVWN